MEFADNLFADCDSDDGSDVEIEEYFEEYFLESNTEPVAFLHFIHRNEHIGIFGHAYIARACAGGGTAPYTTLALATGGSFEFVYIITE